MKQMNYHIETEVDIHRLGETSVDGLRREIEMDRQKERERKSKRVMNIGKMRDTLRQIQRDMCMDWQRLTWPDEESKAWIDCDIYIYIYAISFHFLSLI